MQAMKIEISDHINGSILDIGGGGECVIGQVFGSRVIAIDNMQEELDEAPDCCEKRLMDAAELLFPDDFFDNVTFFYSLMYMTRDTQKAAICEAARVLKPEGCLYIWDCDIRRAWPDPFLVDLDIVSEGKTIHTSYGIAKTDAQDSGMISQFLQSADLDAACVSKEDGHFFIRCKKRSGTP